MNDRLTFQHVAELEQRAPRQHCTLDGAALRTQLITAGLLRERVAHALTILRLAPHTPVLRIDDAGRAEAARIIARGLGEGVHRGLFETPPTSRRA